MTEHGFSNAAIGSAHAFRAIMQAMARPGTVFPLDGAVECPPALFPSTAAVALTLCDYQTPAWLSPSLDSEALRKYLRFHAGVPITGKTAEAHFAFLTASDMTQDFSHFSQGTHDYPDRSTTLVVQVKFFAPAVVEISGPGIAQPKAFGAEGLDSRFWQAMAENHRQFPIGIDVIFAAPGMIAALPRSTAVRMLEAA